MVRRELWLKLGFYWLKWGLYSFFEMVEELRNGDYTLCMILLCFEQGLTNIPSHGLQLRSMVHSYGMLWFMRSLRKSLEFSSTIVIQLSNG